MDNPSYQFDSVFGYSFGVSNSAPTLKVLVYSDDSAVRASIKISLGRRPSVDFGDVEILECATQPAVIAAVDSRPFDLLILDGKQRHPVAWDFAVSLRTRFSIAHQF